MTDYARTEIPARFWGMTLDDFEAETPAQVKMRKAVAEWIAGLPEYRAAGYGLCLAGKPGQGKTMLACIAGLAAFDKGFSVYYVTLAGYLRRSLHLMSLHDAWVKADDPDKYRQWVATDERLIEIRNKFEILILDDVGKEHTTHTNWAEDEFDFLVRYRYDHALPTILTSNVMLMEWGGRYSSAMQSFMHEACAVVGTEGADYRKTPGRFPVRRPGILGGDG